MSNYYSTGRGGAGNIARGEPEPPKEIRPGEVTPKITSHYYTTGRGGAGNMRENKDENETRAAQDVDEADTFNNDAFPSVSNSSIGRGGYGNLKAAKRSSLMDKAKNLFKSSN